MVCKYRMAVRFSELTRECDKHRLLEQNWQENIRKEWDIWLHLATYHMDQNPVFFKFD